MRTIEERRKRSTATSSSRKNSYFYEPGYPRFCDYCLKSVEFSTSNEFSRHIRTSHTTQEGGSFLCRYGENGVCQKLPPEGVCDLDFETHIRRFHTTHSTGGSVFPDEEECMSLRSIRLTSETPTDFAEQRRKFSLTSFTQNLSAVLADPGRSRNETSAFFTRHWGDTFVPQTTVAASKKLPKISKASFEKYNKTTGESYKRYRSIRRALRLSHCEGGSLGDDKQDADDLPTIFIHPTFSLADPDTFSSVFTVPPNENQDALRKTLSGKNVVPATPVEVATTLKAGEFRDYESLQNRLEMMHDVVDGRLAAKLVSKTDAFWQVVRSYSGLQEHLAVAMESVKVVRSNLKQVDELVCDQSAKIVKVHRENERKRNLLAKLHDISCLREAQSTVQMMLSQGDYPKAIDCIETSLEILSKDLSGVTCFRHLSSQLRELYDVIGRMMKEDFASVIQRELGVKPDQGTLIQHEGELSAVLLGLMRVRNYSFVNLLRREIIENVGNVMSQVIKVQILESGVDLSGFDPSLKKLGEPVRAMKHGQFANTVQAVMDELFEFCKRLEALQELMIEIAERVGGKEQNLANLQDEEIGQIVVDDDDDEEEEDADSEDTFNSSNGLIKEKISMNNASATLLLSMEVKSDTFLRKILPLVAEFGYQCAQKRIARLLIARAKNATLTETTTPGQLSQIVQLVTRFQDKCEWYETENRKSGALARAMNRLSMDYIEKFHSARKIRIGNMLDTELWKSCDVQSVDQMMIRQAMETQKLRNIAAKQVNVTKPSDIVMVGSEPFIIVGSAITMIHVLADYCEAIREMPRFAQDWNSRVIELLKVFNSRCCQLILGAGALQLVGLKTISVRNLALASRSLEFICRFVPMVHDEMDRILPDDRKGLLRYFKQVENEYGEHVNEIVVKLISVIDHYTSTCLTQWEVKGQIPSPEFTQICKHLLKFHNGLTGIMPRDQIQTLFQKVHNGFKENLRERIAVLAITPHDTLKYGYVTQDYMFYQQNMKMMENCRDLELESLNDLLFT